MGRVDHRVSGALIGWFSFVAAFATLQYAGQLLSDPPEDVAYRWASSISALASSTIVLAIALLLARGRGFRDAFALHRPRSWSSATVVSVAVILAVVAVSAALAPFANPEAEQGLVPTEWRSDRVAPFLAFAFTVVVVAPLIEEMMFRGIGFSLLQAFGERVAVIVVGVAFGLVHGLVEGFLIIAVFGTGLAVLRSRTQSLYPCILLHAAFNATALVLGLTT
jgi:membrane protease YdiL (CAAX protease family)